MSPTEPQARYCQFTDLKNGIWKFTFTESSNRAVDEWFDWQTYIKETNPIQIDERALMLLDVRKSGPPPLLYTLQQGRDWRKKHPDINNYQIKVALLFFQLFPRLQQPYIKMVKDGVMMFTMEQIKIELFFNEEQKAIDWLLTK